MVLAVSQLDQSIKDSDVEDEQRFAEVLERLRHCSTSNCELFTRAVKHSHAPVLSTASSTDTDTIWWQLTAPTTQLPQTLSATTRLDNGRHLATQIGVSRDLPIELPVGSTTQFTAIASVAGVAAAPVTMSPALVMIDRYFRPAFDSTVPSTLEPSTIVHQLHQQHANPSYPTRDNSGCIAFPSSISPSIATATTTPETSRSSTPILLRPAVVATSNLLPVSGVSSPESSTAQVGLPLHDALSRFRVYRRSGFLPPAASLSMSLTTEGQDNVNVIVSCGRVKIPSGPAAPIGAMMSRVCIRRDVLSPSNAPDDEVRDLLETGSTKAADDDDLGVADIRRKVYCWTVTKAAKSNQESSNNSAVSKVGTRRWKDFLEPSVADVGMSVDTTTTAEIDRCDDVISDEDVDTDDDDQCIDDPVDAPWPNYEPSSSVDDKVISPRIIASLPTAVQRPSLDFDKMQRTCFRRQRVQHGAIRKPRVITLKNAGWPSPDLKRSSVAYNPALFSFRSLSAVKSSTSSRHRSADRGNTRSMARGNMSPSSV